MDAAPLADLIDAFSTHQRAIGRARGTTERYRYTFQLFRRFLVETGLPDDDSVLATPVVERFAIWLRDTPLAAARGKANRDESTVHAHLRDLRAFVRWLQKHGRLEREVSFPMPKLPRRLFRILTDEELRLVWRSRYLTGNGTLAIRNRAMIALMLDTGLRREEVAGLTLDSISLNRRRLTVIGKGDKERQMVFSATVRDHLKAFLAIRGVDEEPLFHLSAAGIRTTFRRIQEEVGLEKFHLHQLRHQFATAMLREKTPLELIGVMLGHEDYNTTRRYLSLDESDIQAAHERASPFESMLGRTREAEPPKRRRRYSNRDAA